MKRLGLSLVGLLVTLLLIIQIPFVQNQIFKRLLDYWNSQTQFSIQHQYFRYKWLSQIVLTGVEIKDPHNQSLLAIQHIKVQINPLKLLIKPRWTIENIAMEGAQIQLIKHVCEQEFNGSILLQSLKNTNSKASNSSSKSKPWLLKQVHLKDIAVLIDDQNKAPVNEGLDTNHIAVEKIAVHLSNLQMDERGLAVDIKHTAGYYKNQALSLDKLCGYCKLLPNGLQVMNLNLETGRSHLQGNIQVNYDQINHSARFMDQVHGVVQLDEVKVDAAELSKFVPYFAQYGNQHYMFSGKVVGRANDFDIDNFQFQFGEQPSQLHGHISIRNLTQWHHAFFSVNLGQSCIYMQDLLPYVPVGQHKNLAPLKVCTLQGNFFGTPQNFISKANFDTGLGKVGMDVEITMDSDFQTATYQGSIATDQLDIGVLLDNDQLQQLTMQAQLAGQGLSLSTAAMHIQADIKELGFNQYIYQDIHTDGEFEKSFFAGNLTIADPNLNFQANATIDWREAIKKVDIQGSLKKAVLHQLHITGPQSCLSTDIAVSAQGSSLDDLNTDAVFRQVRLDWDQKPLYLQELHIRNIYQEGYNKFELVSDLFDVQAEGGTAYTALAQDLQQFIQAYQHRLAPQKYFKPQYTDQPYQFSCLVNLKETDPLWHLILPDVHIAPNTTFNGQFQKGDAVALTVELSKVDTVTFKDSHWENTCLSVQASQQPDGSMLSAVGKLAAEKQHWGKKHMTNQLALEITWDEDQIFLATRLQHPEQPHKLAIQGKAKLGEENIQLKFNQADIQISDRLWRIHPDNLILIKNSAIEIHHTVFDYEGQQISLEGTWSTKQDEDLKLGFHGFALDHFNVITPRKISGIANGSILLQGTLQKLFANSDIHIRDIYVGNLLIGTLDAKSDWDHGKQQLNLTCQVAHGQEANVYIKGAYKPMMTEKGLDLAAEFSKAQLAMLEPFVGDLFSQLGGEIDGRVDIQGTLSHPQIKGEAHVSHGTIKINYLNALYHCEGTIHCNENSIYTDALNLTDDGQGKAVVRGAMKHQRFDHVQFDLKADVDNFKVLETTNDHNKDFYGIGIASGQVSLTGPVDQVAINIKAATKPGTTLTIPVQKYGKQVGQEDYIKFVDLQAPKHEEKKQGRVVKIKGLTLNMELEVTSDAWVSIILNVDNGDTIQAKGKANLGIKVDEEGALSMTGHYELVEGKYSFSIYNMVRKQFKISPGSSITWYDKPYEGILQVKAAYEQRVSLTPLLAANAGSEGGGDNKEAANKFPVSVVLMLKGILSKPDIKFDIAFEETPQEPALKAAVNKFLSRIAADEPYLMNQAFSLVILKRFFSKDLAAGTTLGRSVGELFSQQLNSFAAQLDENLEIDTDIDLADLEKGARLKLGYNLLGGRLKVSREGSINLQNEKETDASNLVGDWTVEYMLTKDNRLRIKIYNKHIRTNEEKNGSATFAGGVSLRYVKSFNWWKELFGIHRGQRRKYEKETAKKGSSSKN